MRILPLQYLTKDSLGIRHTRPFLFRAMYAYHQLRINNYAFADDDRYDLLNTVQAGEQVIAQNALAVSY